MQIAWCAAVDEPALKMPAAELNAAARSVAITSAHVAADPSGGVAAEFSRTEAESVRCRLFRRDRRPVQDTGSVRRRCPTRPGCPK